MTPAIVLVAALDAASARESDASVAPEAAPEPQWVVPIAHDLGLLTTIRFAETFIWPEPFAKTSRFGAHYEDTFTKPPIFDADKPAFQWDGDPLVVNVVGHALLGSELYLRPRMCHFPWYGALAFAAAGSTLWEYAFEGNGVRPSVQDLVYTPLAGIALGEARYALVKLSRTISSPEWGTTLRAVADPFGEFERVLGAPC